MNGLSVTAFENFHEIDQGLNRFERGRVVNRGTATAHAAVPFKSAQVIFSCFGYEFFLQIFIRQAEGDIHLRSAVGIRRTAVKAALIDEIVNQVGFLLIDMGHLFQAAD